MLKITALFLLAVQFFINLFELFLWVVLWHISVLIQIITRLRLASYITVRRQAKICLLCTSKVSGFALVEAILVLLRIAGFDMDALNWIASMYKQYKITVLWRSCSSRKTKTWVSEKARKLKADNPNLSFSEFSAIIGRLIDFDLAMKRGELGWPKQEFLLWNKLILQILAMALLLCRLNGLKVFWLWLGDLWSLN